MLRRRQQTEFGKTEVAKMFFEEAMKHGLPPQSIFSWLYLMELEGGSPYAVTVEGNKTRSYGPWQINDARAEGIRKLGLKFPDDIYATRNMQPTEIQNRIRNHIRYIIEQDKQIRAALKKYNPAAYEAIFGKSMSELSPRELAYLVGYYMASWNAPAFAERVAKGDFRPLIPGVAVYKLADFKRRNEAFVNALRNWERLTSEFVAKQRRAVSQQLQYAIYDALSTPTIQRGAQRAPVPAMPYQELRLALMPGLVQTLNALPHAVQMALPEAIEEAKKHFRGMEDLLPADKAKQPLYATALALIGTIRRQDTAFSTAWGILPDDKKRKILDAVVHWSQRLKGVKDEAERQKLETEAITEIARLIHPAPLSSEYFKEIARSALPHLREFFVGSAKELGVPVAVFAMMSKKTEWQNTLKELDRIRRNARGIDKQAADIVHSAFTRDPVASFIWGGVLKGLGHMVASITVGTARQIAGYLPTSIPGAEKLQELTNNAMLWVDKWLGPPLVSESEKLAEDPEFRRQHLREAVMFLASSGLKGMLKLVGNRYEPTNDGWNLYASSVLQTKVWEIFNSVLKKQAKDHWAFRLVAETKLGDFRNIGPIIGISMAGRLLGLASRASQAAARSLEAENALASMSVLAETGNVEAALKLAGGLANLTARQRMLQRVIGTIEAMVTPGSLAEKGLHRLFLNAELKKMGIDGITGLEAIAKNAGTEAALNILKEVAPKVAGKSKIASAFFTGAAYTWAGMPTHLEGPEAIGNFLGGFLVNAFLDAPRLYGGVVDLIKGKKRHPHDVLSHPLFADVLTRIYEEGFVKYMTQEPTTLRANLDEQILSSLRALGDLNAIGRLVRSKNFDKITLVLNIPTEKELRISRHIDTSFKDAIAALPDRERRIITRMIEAFKLFEDAKRDARRRKKVPDELSVPPDMSEADWFQYIMDSWVRRMSNRKIWGKKGVHPRDIARSIAALHILTHARWFGEYFAKDDPVVAQKVFGAIISYGLRSLEEAEKKIGEIQTKDLSEAATKTKEFTDEFLKAFYSGFPLFADLFKSYLSHKLTLFTAASIAKSGGVLKDTEEELQVKLLAANSKMLNMFITNLPKFLMRFASGESREDLVRSWEEVVEPALQAVISDIVEPSKIVDIAKSVVADKLRLVRPTKEATPWREIVRNLKALEAAVKAEKQERKSEEAKGEEVVAQLASGVMEEIGTKEAEEWARREMPKVSFSEWGEDYMPAPVDTSTGVPLVSVEPNEEWRKVWRVSKPDNPEIADEARRTWDTAIRSFALSLLFPPEVAGKYISEESKFPILTIVSPSVAFKIRQIPEVTNKFHIIAVDAGTAGNRAPDQPDEVILIWARKQPLTEEEKRRLGGDIGWTEEDARKLGAVVRDILWKERIPSEFWHFVRRIWSTVSVEDIPRHIKVLFAGIVDLRNYPDFFKKRMGFDTEGFNKFVEFLDEIFDHLKAPENGEYLTEIVNKIQDEFQKGMGVMESQFIRRFVESLDLASKIGIHDLTRIGTATLFIALSPFGTLEHQYRKMRSVAFFFADHFVPMASKGQLKELKATLRTNTLEPSLTSRVGPRRVYVRNGNWDFKVSEDGTHWVVVIPEEEETLFWAYYAARLQHATAFFDARHIVATATEEGTHKLFDFSPAAVFLEFVKLRAPSDKMGEFVGKFEEAWEAAEPPSEVYTVVSKQRGLFIVPWVRPDIVIDIVERRTEEITDAFMNAIATDEAKMRLVQQITGLTSPEEIRNWVQEQVTKIFLASSLTPISFPTSRSFINFGAFLLHPVDIDAETTPSNVLSRAFIWTSNIEHMFASSAHEFLHIFTSPLRNRTNAIEASYRQLSPEEQQQLRRFLWFVVNELLQEGGIIVRNRRFGVALIKLLQEISPRDDTVLEFEHARNVRDFVIDVARGIREQASAYLAQQGITIPADALLSPVMSAISALEERTRKSRFTVSDLTAIIDSAWSIIAAIQGDKFIDEGLWAQLALPEAGVTPETLQIVRNELRRVLLDAAAPLAELSNLHILVKGKELADYIASTYKSPVNVDEVYGQLASPTELVSYLTTTYADITERATRVVPEGVAAFSKFMSLLYSGAYEEDFASYLARLFPTEVSADMFHEALQAARERFGNPLLNVPEIVKASFVLASIFGEQTNLLLNPMPEVAHELAHSLHRTAVALAQGPVPVTEEARRLFEDIAKQRRISLHKELREAFGDMIEETSPPSEMPEDLERQLRQIGKVVVPIHTDDPEFRRSMEELVNELQKARETELLAKTPREIIESISEKVSEMKVETEIRGALSEMSLPEFITTILSLYPPDQPQSYDLVMGLFAATKPSFDELGRLLFTDPEFAHIGIRSTNLFRAILEIMMHFGVLQPLSKTDEVIREVTALPAKGETESWTFKTLKAIAATVQTYLEAIDAVLNKDNPMYYEIMEILGNPDKFVAERVGSYIVGQMISRMLAAAEEQAVNLLPHLEKIVGREFTQEERDLFKRNIGSAIVADITQFIYSPNTTMHILDNYFKLANYAKNYRMTSPFGNVEVLQAEIGIPGFDTEVAEFLQNSIGSTAWRNLEERLLAAKSERDIAKISEEFVTEASKRQVSGLFNPFGVLFFALVQKHAGEKGIRLPETDTLTLLKEKLAGYMIPDLYHAATMPEPARQLMVGFKNVVAEMFGIYRIAIEATKQPKLLGFETQPSPTQLLNAVLKHHPARTHESIFREIIPYDLLVREIVTEYEPTFTYPQLLIMLHEIAFHKMFHKDFLDALPDIAQQIEDKISNMTNELMRVLGSLRKYPEFQRGLDEIHKILRFHARKLAKAYIAEKMANKPVDIDEIMLRADINKVLADLSEVNQLLVRSLAIVPNAHVLLNGLLRAAVTAELVSEFHKSFGSVDIQEFVEKHPKPWLKLLELEEEGVQSQLQRTISNMYNLSITPEEFGSFAWSAAYEADWTNSEDVSVRKLGEVIDALYSYAFMKEPPQRIVVEPTVKDVMVRFAQVAKSYLNHTLSWGLLSVGEVYDLTQRLNQEIGKIISAAVKEGWAEAPFGERVDQAIWSQKGLADLMNYIGRRIFTNALSNMTKRIATARELKSISKGEISDAIAAAKNRIYFTPPVQEVIGGIVEAFRTIFDALPREYRETIKHNPQAFGRTLQSLMIEAMDEILETWEATPGSSTHIAVHAAMNNFFLSWLSYYTAMFRDLYKSLGLEAGKKTKKGEIAPDDMSNAARLANMIINSAINNLKTFTEIHEQLKTIRDVMLRSGEEPRDILADMADIVETYRVQKADIPKKDQAELKKLLDIAAEKWEPADKEHLEILKRNIGEGMLKSLIVGFVPYITDEGGKEVVDAEKVQATLAHYERVLRRFEQNAEQARKAGNAEEAAFWERQAEIINTVMWDIEEYNLARVGLVHLSEGARKTPEFQAFLERLREVFVNAVATDVVAETVESKFPKPLQDAVLESIRVINAGVSNDTAGLKIAWNRKRGAALNKFLVGLSLIGATAIVLPYLPHLMLNIAPALLHDIGRGIVQMMSQSMTPHMWFGFFASALTSYLLRKKTANISKVLVGALSGVSQWLTGALPRIEQALAGVSNDIVSFVRRNMGETMAAIAHAVIGEMQVPAAWKNLAILPHLANQIAKLRTQGTFPTRSREPAQLAEEILNYTLAAAVLNQSTALGAFIHDMAKATENTLIQKVALTKFLQDPAKSEGLILDYAVKKALKLLSTHGPSALDMTFGSFSKRTPLKLSRIGYIEDPATGQRQPISLDVNNAFLTVGGQRKAVADMTLREVLEMGLGHIAGADLDALLTADPATFGKILKRIVSSHSALLRNRISGQLVAHLDDEARQAIKFISSFIHPVAMNLMTPAKKPYLAAALATHHEVQAAFLIGLRYLQSLISHPYAKNLFRAAGYDVDQIVAEIENFWGGLRRAGVSPKLIEDIDRVMSAIKKEIRDTMTEITAKSLTPQAAMVRIRRATERIWKSLSPLFVEATYTRYTPLTKAVRGKVLPFLLGAPFLSLENDLKEAVVELRHEGFNQELFSVATSTFPERVRNLPEIIAMEQTLRSGKVSPMQMLDAFDHRIDALLKELAKALKVKYEDLSADFDTLLATLYIHSHTRMEPQHLVESIDDVFRKRLPQPVKSWAFDPSRRLGGEAEKIRQKLYQIAFPYVVLLNYLVKGHGMKAYLGDIYNGVGPAFALTEERYVPQWGDATQKPQILIAELIQDVFGRLPHRPPKQPFEFTRTGRGTVPFENFRDAMRRAIYAFKTKQVIDKNRPLIEGVIAFMPPPLKHLLAWQLANALSPMGMTGYRRVPWTFEVGEDIAKAVEDMFDAAGNYYKTYSEALAKRQGDALDKLLAAFQTQVLWLNPRSPIRQISSLFYAASQLCRDFNDPMAYYIVGVFYPRAISIIRALLKGDTSKLNDFERFVLENSPEIQSRHLVTIRETLNSAQEVLEKLMARPEGAKLLETLLDPSAPQADREAAVQRLEELFILGTDPAWWKEAMQKVKEWGFAMLRLNDEAAVLATKLAAMWMYLAHNDVTGIPDEKTLFAALSYGSALSEAIHSTPLEGFRPTLFRGSREKGVVAWARRAFFIPQVFSQFMVYTFAETDTFRRLLGSAYDAIFNKELPLRERIADLASAITAILMLQIGFAAINGFWMSLAQKPLEEQRLGTYTSEEEQKVGWDWLASSVFGIVKSSLPRPLLFGISYILSLMPLRQRILQRTTLGTITERDIPPSVQFLNRVIVSLTNAYTSFSNMGGVEENEATSAVQRYFDRLLTVAPRDQIPGLVADTLQFLSLAASLKFPAASLYPAGLISPATRVVASAAEGLPVPAQITETFGGSKAGIAAQALAGTPAPGGYSELLSPTPRDIAFAVTTRSGEEMAFKFLDVTEKYDVPNFIAELIAVARTAKTSTVFKALDLLTDPNFYISIKRPSATQVIPKSISENHPMVVSVTKLYDAMTSPNPDKFIQFIKSDPIRFAWLTALFGYDYIMDRFSPLSKPDWVKRLKDIGQLEVALLGSGMKPELVAAIVNIAQNSNQANISLYLKHRKDQIRQIQYSRQVARIREQIQAGRRGK